MLNRNVLIILFLSIYNFAGAQNGGEYAVSGTIRDAETNEPLPKATAALLHSKDSSIVTGTVSDFDGNFTLEATTGKYILKVQYLAYDPEFKPNIRLNENNQERNVGTILLNEARKVLPQVLIEGERSQMTMEGGKKIFNVGTDLSTSGASAADVLENIPAVTMDLEGNLSLRGSQGVRILINGKPSSMMGVSGAEVLRYFPANQIERVEIITNPSAKYEAQGAAGIINIILKENQNWGLNGTFTVEAGIPKDHGATVNMNYRKKWYNIFGSYNFSIDRYPGGGWNEQIFNLDDTTYSLRTDVDRSRGGKNHYFQFGSDFYFTPNDVLRISGVYRVEDQDNYTDLTFLDYNGRGFDPSNLLDRTVRNELEKEDERDYDLNMSYEKTFGAEDHKLTADLQLRRSTEVEDASLVESRGFEEEGMDIALFQNSLNDTDVKAIMGKVDYVWPFSDEGKFETGLRAEYRDLRNIYHVEQRESASEPWNTLEQFSNTFYYNEAVYGVYAMYGNRRGRFSYQGGLRLEYTGIGTRLQTENFDNDRSYLNFFPSLALTYHINDISSIQASYSRRLDRPHFRALNPYNTFSNNRNYRTGNPNLDPEFTGAYDLGYVLNRPKSSIYVGGFYRRTVNEIERVDTVNNEGITISMPINLTSEDNVGIEARYSVEIFDWWDFNISSFFYRGSTTGFAAGEDLNAAALTMTGRASVDFDVFDWFKFQINGDYRAPEQEGQDYEKSRYEINMGIRKELFNNKGNVAFSIRDIFNSDVYRSDTEGSNFTSSRRFQWRSGPIFSVSFTYRLKGNDSPREERQRTIFGDDD